jgi:hypothetical protein
MILSSFDQCGRSFRRKQRIQSCHLDELQAAEILRDPERQPGRRLPTTRSPTVARNALDQPAYRRQFSSSMTVGRTIELLDPCQGWS